MRIFFNKLDNQWFKLRPQATSQDWYNLLLEIYNNKNRDNLRTNMKRTKFKKGDIVGNFEVMSPEENCLKIHVKCKCGTEIFMKYTNLKKTKSCKNVLVKYPSQIFR